MKNYLIAMAVLATCATAFSQERLVTLSGAIDEAIKNNASLQAIRYKAQAQKHLGRNPLDLPKTEVTLLYGQYNSFADNDNNISISQSIPFAALGSQTSVNRAISRAVEREVMSVENEITWQVRRTYYQLLYALAFHKLLLQEDSIYQGFVNAATARYHAGESRLLEKSAADEQLNEARIRQGQNESDILKLKSTLQVLTGWDELPHFSDEDLTAIEKSVVDTSGYRSNPTLSVMESQIDVARRERSLQLARFAPDLQIGFFSQTLIGAVNTENGNVAGSGQRFTGFQIGVALPVWFGPHRARVRAAEMNARAAESNLAQLQNEMKAEVESTIRMISLHRRNLDYYETVALPNAARTFNQSQTSFREGEIDYPEYLLGLRTSIGVRENYLKTLNDYNQNVIYLEFLTGK